jgi:hypothetical protein
LSSLFKVFTGNVVVKDTGLLLPNGRQQMEPLRELPSTEDLAGGVQTWLDTNSKFHGQHTPDH